jgi:large subunit ribosomal protein L21
LLDEHERFGITVTDSHYGKRVLGDALKRRSPLFTRGFAGQYDEANAHGPNQHTGQHVSLSRFVHSRFPLLVFRFACSNRVLPRPRLPVRSRTGRFAPGVAFRGNFLPLGSSRDTLPRLCGGRKQEKPPRIYQRQNRKMYAVIRTGGKQYRVQENDTILIEKLDGAEGDTVTLGEVLALGGDNPQFGAPLVSGASVTGTIVRQGKGKKITASPTSRSRTTSAITATGNLSPRSK